MTQPSPTSNRGTGVSPVDRGMGVPWAAIPCFNNAATIFDIAQRALQQLPNVLVIDDGSTDTDLTTLLAPLNIHLLRHPTNRGKGAALQSAFTYAHNHGATHLITLDADGQHFPEDIPTFLPHLTPTTLLLGHRALLTGHRPTSSTFGQNFSDFWIHLETGHTPHDTQSGFRAYPLAPLAHLPLHTSHYNFEVEVITRALWAGLSTQSIPIRVFYPDPAKRISSFRPIKDNLRLSLLHTRLILRQLLPLPHHKLPIESKPKITSQVTDGPSQPLASSRTVQSADGFSTASKMDQTEGPSISPLTSIPSQIPFALTSALAVFLTLLLTIAQFPWGILAIGYLALRLHFPKLLTAVSLVAASTFMFLTPTLPTTLGHALLGPNISPFLAHFTGAHALAFPIALASAILTYVGTRMSSSADSLGR